jgi:hypothetical protein
MCPYQSETVTHILWACPLARNVWSLLPGKVQKLANTEDKDFFDISSLVASILSRSEFEQWAMICWAIWNARNRYVFEGVQDHPSKILESASKLLNDYQGAGKAKVSYDFFQCNTSTVPDGLLLLYFSFVIIINKNISFIKKKNVDKDSVLGIVEDL